MDFDDTNTFCFSLSHIAGDNYSTQTLPATPNKTRKTQTATSHIKERNKKRTNWKEYEENRQKRLEKLECCGRNTNVSYANHHLIPNNYMRYKECDEITYSFQIATVQPLKFKIG